MEAICWGIFSALLPETSPESLNRAGRWLTPGEAVEAEVPTPLACSPSHPWLSFPQPHFLTCWNHQCLNVYGVFTCICALVRPGDSNRDPRLYGSPLHFQDPDDAERS